MIQRIFYPLLLALALITGSVLADEQIRWLDDIGTGRQLASKYKVPLLIHFYGDHCLPCKTLEQRVYSDPELVQVMNKYFICVKVNGSTNPSIAAEYQVHSWPTDVFIGGDGERLHQGVCYQDLKTYLSTLTNVATMNRDLNTRLAAAENAQNLAVDPRFTASNGGSALPPRAGTAANEQQQVGYYNPGVQPNPNGGPSLPAYQTAGVQSQPTSQENVNRQMAVNGTRNTVQTGPLSPAQQPTAIRTNTLAENQQLAAQGRSYSFENNGQLPGPEFQSSQVQNYYANQANGLNGSQNQRTTLPPRQSLESPNSLAGNSLNAPLIAYPQTASSNGDPTNTLVNAGPPQMMLSGGMQIGGSQPVTVQNPYAIQAIEQGIAASTSSAVASNQSPDAGSSPNSATGANDTSVQFPGARFASRSTITQRPGTETTASPSSDSPIGMPENRFVAAGQPAGSATPARLVAFQSRGGAPTATSAGMPPSQQSAQPVGATPLAKPGMEGFCPVALRKSGQWIPGKPEHAILHRGKVYWMSSPEAAAEFATSPDSASPLFGGYDPMTFLMEGKLVEGSIHFGIIEENHGLVILFANSQTKAAFEADFDRNLTAITTVLQKAGM